MEQRHGSPPVQKPSTRLPCAGTWQPMPRGACLVCGYCNSRGLKTLLAIGSEGTMDAKPRILVLEDNYLTAEALCDQVRAAGCDVVGSVGHVPSAVEFVHSREIDGAIVDINLHGHPSFPVCEELKRRKVQFIFVRGYDRSVIPSAFTKYRLLSKPVEQDALKLALAEFAATGSTH